MLDYKVKAPEFAGIKAWINSKPLEMKRLKDKVVLVDFWTYTCINCRRSIPYVKGWHKKYAKKGLVIVGVHSPEFGFEKVLTNVKAAVKELGIRYPVAVDSDMETWEAFDNRYWPAKFLIKDGDIIHAQFGEGRYGQFEGEIQAALGISGKTAEDKAPGYMFDQSPETYAGFARNTGLGSGLVCVKKGCDVYVEPDELSPGLIYPDGQWEQEREYLELKKAPGKLSYRFNAREVNVVMGPVKKPVKADIFVDRKKKKTITIGSYSMYNVYKDKRYRERDISIVFHGKARVFVFTFG